MKDKLISLCCPSARDDGHLEECVRSYVSSEAVKENDIEILILDDHFDPNVMEKKRRFCEELQDDLSIPVRYLDREYRKNFAKKISEVSKVPLSVVEFGVLGTQSFADRGHAYGAARNCLTLLSKGFSLISVDDDTRCAIRKKVSADSSALVVVGGDRSDMNAFNLADGGSSTQAFQSAEFFPNLVRVLGKDVRDLVSGPIENQGDACSHLIRDIAALRPARVKVVEAGAYGASGISSHRSLLLGDSGSMAKCRSNWEYCQELLSTSNLSRQAPALGVSHSPHLMTMCFGIDLHGTVPPFFPLFRGEDRLFSELVVRCLNGCYVGRLPMMIQHIGQTRYRRTGTQPIKFADVMSALFRVGLENVSSLDDDSLRMESLGYFLFRMGDSGVDSFRGLLIECLRDLAIARCDHISELLAAYPDANLLWRQTALEEAFACEHAYRHAHDEGVYEFRALGADAGLLRMQSLVRDFGEVLCNWHRIAKASYELKSQTA